MGEFHRGGTGAAAFAGAAAGAAGLAAGVAAAGFAGAAGGATGDGTAAGAGFSAGGFGSDCTEPETVAFTPPGMGAWSAGLGSSGGGVEGDLDSSGMARKTRTRGGCARKRTLTSISLPLRCQRFYGREDCKFS